SGWGADPDGDGIRNGEEYYFHMNPIAGVPPADQPGLPNAGLRSDGINTYLTFSYRRLFGWSGNVPIVAISSDLVNWDTSQTQIELRLAHQNRLSLCYPSGLLHPRRSPSTASYSCAQR